MSGLPLTPVAAEQTLSNLKFGSTLPKQASKPTATANEAELRSVASEYESVFIAQMMQHMFSGIETDPMFGGGKGEEVFRGMMVQEYGKIITEAGGIGLADRRG